MQNHVDLPQYSAVFSDRYSLFCYEPQLGGNKFYDVEGFPAIILPEKKSTKEGKYGYAKSRRSSPGI